MKVNEAQNHISGTELSPRPAQHIPTPWRVKKGRPLPPNKINIFATPGGQLFGIATLTFNNEDEEREQLANAELIVRAVNNHQVLITAIKSAIEQLEQNPDITLDALDELRAALRVAGVN